MTPPKDPDGPDDNTNQEEPSFQDIQFKPEIVDSADISDNVEDETSHVIPKQPVYITIPGSALQLVKDGLEQTGEVLRLTFFLHKDDSLFPSKDFAEWVNKILCCMMEMTSAV